MNRPDDIPQDIWDTAIECADVVEHAYWPGVKVFARALMSAASSDDEVSINLSPEEAMAFQREKNKWLSDSLKRVAGGNALFSKVALEGKK